MRVKKENTKLLFARNLRKGQTEAEKLVWFKLRNRQVEGLKFRRQQRIGKYIVDFVCFEKKLIIELDGSQHSEVEYKRRDETRTDFLEKEGYRVYDFGIMKSLLLLTRFY